MSSLLSGISSSHLRRAITIKQRIENLESRLQKLLSGSYSGNGVMRTRTNAMSAAGRARIAAAQKKRWAAWRKAAGKS